MNRVQQRLLASGKTVPVNRLGLPRSTAYYQPRERKAWPLDEVLAARIQRIHQEEPSCGVRGTWSRLRFRDGLRVNRKKVHRIMKLRGWTLPKCRAGCRVRSGLERGRCIAWRGFYPPSTT